jgi:alpha-mannosidase
MKPLTLHLIGNAHIDPVWLWTWQEGFHEAKATFRSALDRLTEFPQFVFTASSAALYAWIEQSDPAMFAEIQQRVREGRWELAGGWWIEPDCNIPCGESFVRQGLLGQRFFQQKFGRKATVAYNVDSFGHNIGLPQIMLKSGLDSYVFMRPMHYEKNLPADLFWWESPDGSRILTFRLPVSYGTPGGDQREHVLACSEQACACSLQAHGRSMCFYGVGNHGGGPTIQAIQSLLDLQSDPARPADLLFSGPSAFFDLVRPTADPFPVVLDELQHHASGCYSAHSGIKRWNRQAENRLLAAEKWSSLASWTASQPYPSDFNRAWQDVLFNQFHDILAGTSLEIAYDHARDSYGEAISIADRALNLALQSFAWRIRIPQEETARPIVVFNPLAFPVTVPVEIEFDRWDDSARLLDDSGRSLPFQGADSPTTPWRRSLCFLADLPALGYCTYRITSASRFGDWTPTDTSAPDSQPPAIPGVPGASAPVLGALRPGILENPFLRLELDTQTGCISSLYDKTHQVQVFSAPAARPLVYHDDSDTWSHGVFRFDQLAGEFKLTNLTLSESGPVKSVLRAISTYEASSLVQEFHLYRDLPFVEVRLTVDWRQHNQLLKLRFPVSVSAPAETLNVACSLATYDQPYAVIQRPSNGDEETCQAWIDVSGTHPANGQPYGLALLNDAKYSCDVQGSDIGLTVLRSPAYAHHLPAQLEPGGFYTYQDQGLQRFTYRLLPHSGPWQDARLSQSAAELNQPPVALLATFHPNGDLPQSASFIDVDPPNVLVTALKQAEDASGLILRAWESTGASSHVRLSLPPFNRSLAVGFGPFELKTFLIPSDPSLPIREVNLLEE